MGAAGLTCSTSEMASAGNSGVEIELQLVPRREAAMEPWEVMMSESQERMLVCIKKGKEKEIERIFSKWDLHGVVIGKVIEGDVVRVKDKGKVVAEIRTRALTEAPIYDMPYKKPEYLDEIKKFDVKRIPEQKTYNNALLAMLGSPSLSNKYWVYEQYDHMVQTNTAVLPGSDAAVLRLKGTRKAVAVTTDCNGRYCYLNPYVGAEIAVAEAARNLVCSGAEPAAVTDCLNFGNPEKPDRFWQFKHCVEGIADACKSFNIPVVSGNVSFYNENPKGAIYPTPTIGMIGIVDNIKKVCTQSFKNRGDLIVLLGTCTRGLGGSTYIKVVHRQVKGDAPELDLRLEMAVQQAVLEAIKKELLSSAHDCSDGGLVTALCESCITDKEKMIGAIIELDELKTSDMRTDETLFGEATSRIVVSLKKDNLRSLEGIARKHSIPCQVIGNVNDQKRFLVRHKKDVIIDLPLTKLSDTWRDAIPSRL